MTPQEAVSYIENYGWSNSKAGLDRTRKLVEALGNPQKNLKFIHVAGSNGKGSTCAMFDAIFRAAGYKSGLYTSPYIQEFNERIQINGVNISGDDLARITQRVKEIADKMEDHPSQFELVTAIALEYFAEEKCDIVILEVGMGGALDSTNIIDAPVLACITNIGLEHTEYLGNTIEEIAHTKGGIIKNGSYCVCYDGDPKVTNVIKDICEEKNVPLACVDFSNLELITTKLDGQHIKWQGKPYRINLIGNHQLHNAALVLTGIDVLNQIGFDIPDEAVLEGLSNVCWPARLEILNKSPLFILDGGHNPQCAEALTSSLNTLLPNKKVVFLVGVLADKDYDSIMNMVIPYAQEFVCLTPLSDRALSGEKLAEYLKEKGSFAVPAKTYEQGIVEAMKRAGSDGCVVAFGSLYMAGEVRSLFKHAYRVWLRKSKIAARDAYNQYEREMISALAVENIINCEEFKKAKTIMVYEATRGELTLKTLFDHPEAKDKVFCYPLCLEDNQMIALKPQGPDSFVSGYCGIKEPVRELSDEINPKDIDLVLSPCSAFDERCNRMGMGRGFYDRFLVKCTNAKVAAIAFEVQKLDAVPVYEWDVPMDMVVTENGVYRK